MVRRSLRSTSFRQIKVKTPGGRVVVHYRKAKPQRASCAITGEKLAGVASERPSKMRKMSKTSKRPSRPFGGVLSSKGMRLVLRQKAKQMDAPADTGDGSEE